MATERGGEEARTRRIIQQQPSKRRKDDWHKSSVGLKNCRSEPSLGLRPQTRKTRSESDMQAPEDDGPGREARPQLGVRQI